MINHKPLSPHSGLLRSPERYGPTGCVASPVKRTSAAPPDSSAASLTRLVERLAIQSLPGRLKGAASWLGLSMRAQGLGSGKPATFSRRAARSVLELAGRSRTQSRPSRPVDQQPRCGALEVAVQEGICGVSPLCACAGSAHS